MSPGRSGSRFTAELSRERPSPSIVHDGQTPSVPPDEVAETQAFHSAVLASVLDPLWVTDSAFRIVYWNEAAAAAFGWTAEEVQGRHTGELFRTLVPGSSREDAIRQLMRTGHFRGEAVCHGKDGRPILVEASSRVVRGSDGEVVHIVNTARDIADRKRAEEALHKSEHQLRLATQAAGMYSWELDVATGDFRFSGDVKAVLGVSYSEPDDVFARIRRYAVPEDGIRYAQALQRTMRGEGDLESVIRIVNPGTHELVWMETHATLMRDAEGAPLRVVGIARNITERKRTETALKKSEERLSSELEAARQLQKISGQLIRGESIGALYDAILEAAVSVMRSDCGSIQILHPERGDSGELHLTRHRGFTQEAAAFWEWVRPNSHCACGMAWGTRQRVVVPDVLAPGFMADSADQKIYVKSGICAVQTTPLFSRSGRLLGMISTHWHKRHNPSDHDLALLDVLARQAADLIERAQVEEALREREGWLRGQHEALEAEVNDVPLETSLGVLVRAATDGLGQDARAAFYLTDGEGAALRHVVGMPVAYAEAVDGFKVGPESLACAFARHNGQPVLTRDVTKDARWAPWLSLAERFDYRGCWSFPIRTSGGRLIGMLAVYSKNPREPSARDRELASLLTQTASVIISRYVESKARKQAEKALRASEEQFRRAIEDAPIPVIMHAEDGQVLQLSRTWTDLTGYRAEDMPTFEAWLNRACGEGAEAVREPMLELFQGARRSMGVEFPFRTCDGETRHWSFSASAPGALADGRRFVVGMALDITERKRSEEQLARDVDAMARLQKLGALSSQEGSLEPVLTEIVDAAIAISGADLGSIQLLDPHGRLQIAAHRGFPPWWLEFWNSVAKGQGVCGTALERGERILVEDVERSPIFVGSPALDIQRKAGVRAVQSTPLISRSGKRLGVFSTHYRKPGRPDDRALRLLDLLARQAADLIDQKQAEEELRRSREEYRHLVEASGSVILRVDKEMRITFVNRHGLRFFGYAPDEILGRRLLGTIVPRSDEAGRDTAATVEDILRHPDRYRTTVHQNMRKDGSLVWMSWTNQPTCDEKGNVIEILSIGNDLTELKQAEEALRESEARYRELVRLAPAGIYEMNLRTGRLTSVNDAIIERLGYSREELLAMSPGDLLDAESRVRFQDRAARWLSGEKPEANAEYRVRTKDGRTLDMLLAVSFTVDRAGKPFGAAVVAQDITDRKRAEEELQANREALREANSRLTEADRRKNEFLAVLSHELRNPLAPISNSLYILDHAPAGGDLARRAREVVGRQVGQLSRLVNDLLDVTRITRGKVQLQKERIELNEVVRRAVEDNRSSFDQGGVSLDLVPAPGPVPVIADSSRIAQVVGNLLQNAAKFTSQGGHAHVVVAAGAREAIVRVVDDGVGIPQGTLSRLFEPFTQAEQTLDRSQGGLGLGLALVKGLVELHGGTVSARSEGAGRGTEIVVRLPLHTGAALETAATRVSLVRARRRRILIIEDNVDAADSLREALEIAEHEVAVAYDGRDGIARAREFRPEVVLCDIGLPGMNGYDVARAFRADEALRGTFLVALSGYALPEDLQRAADTGFERHIAKPPDIQKLEEMLGSIRPAEVNLDRVAR